jgi:hypothetical protein
MSIIPFDPTPTAQSAPPEPCSVADLRGWSRPERVPVRPWTLPVRSAEEFQSFCGSVEQTAAHCSVGVLATAMEKAHTATALHGDILSRSPPGDFPIHAQRNPADDGDTLRRRISRPSSSEVPDTQSGSSARHAFRLASLPQIYTMSQTCVTSGRTF